LDIFYSTDANDGMAVFAEDGVVAAGADVDTPAAVDMRGGGAVPEP
jgi:hypothetical protein